MREFGRSWSRLRYWRGKCAMYWRPRRSMLLHSQRLPQQVECFVVGFGTVIWHLAEWDAKRAVWLECGLLSGG